MRPFTLLLGLILAVLVSCVADKARADSEFRSGSDWIRITALACSDEAVIAKITEAGEDPHDYRAASASVNGQAFSACWKPLFASQVVYLIYADADRRIIPFGALHPLKEA